MKASYKEIHKDYFLMNGTIFPAEKFDPHEITKTTSVYEVVRVISGVALFLEEHLHRLNNSIKLLHYSYTIDIEQIKQQIYQLITLNKCYNYNIKLIINNLHTTTPNIFIFFIDSNYPTETQYNKGVSTILYKGERDNPNAKVVAKSFRQEVNKAIKKAGAYEALLLDHSNQVTEGSRSNIFFIKENVLYTAPSDKILKGVTRNRVIDLSKNMDIEVEEMPISLDFLKNADALFMTGTSPNVLPIASVDDMLYGSSNNPIVLKVKQAYDNLISQYIGKTKKIL
ncbi:MAG: aminotransferase class IV family protein [Clostridiaceae bacterium]|nr:aminotransferase class IV family protein [Clostridiaceae bacterium]